MTKKTLSFLAAIGLLTCATTTRAELIYAVNGNNELLTFDSATPAVILSRTVITGTGGNDILNIDFRPATGQLFALSGNNSLYTINLGTGVASFVGATGITGGFDYAFDFNPVPDRIRVATDSAGNFRVNPDNTSTLTTDPNLFYIGGDPNSATAPQVGGAAYTNNFGPSPRTPPPGTSLYYIDFNLNILALSPNPNLGELMTIGGLGLDVTGLLSFDISGVTGVAFASLSQDANTSSLYTIDLATGTATLVGSIGAGGEAILGMSAAPIPEPSTYALLGFAALGLVVLRFRKIKTA